MLVTSIDKKLRDAICVVVNYNMGYHEFTTEENKTLLRDSLTLLNEYASCFNLNGELSQRGEVPSAWNKDTIFENHRATTDLDSNQMEFDFMKKVEPSEDLSNDNN